MKLFLPCKVNLDRIIRDYPVIGIPHFSKDKLAYFLNLIIEVAVKNKHLDLPNGFVPLSSKLMQSVDRDYSKYLDYAIKAGIIITDNRYIVKEKCKGFKFSPIFSSILVEYTITEPGLNRRLNRLAIGNFKLPQGLKFLAKPFKSGKLKFDHEAALRLLNEQHKYFTDNPGRIPPNRKTNRPKDPISIYNYWLLCIERLSAEEYYMSVDDTVNRLHTPLTNMPSILRNFLSYGGKKLVSIDIKNCQPYLAIAALKSEFYSPTKLQVKRVKFCNEKSSKRVIQVNKVEKLNIYHINKSINQKIKKAKVDIRILLMLVKCIETRTGKGFEQYKTLCAKGKIYEYIQTAISRELGLEFTDREMVKIAVFQVLFTANRYTGLLAPLKMIFSKLFPEVYEIFVQLKKEDKTILPCLLQSLESWLVLKVICKRIYQERPHLPLFTIHDSIITTEGNEGFIQEIMRQELQRMIGLPPKLKTEVWQPGRCEKFK